MKGGTRISGFSPDTCSNEQLNIIHEAVCSTAKSTQPTNQEFPGSANTNDSSYARNEPRFTISLRCRICLDSGGEKPLLSPCLCKGTMGLIHKACLEEWLTVAQSGKCEICGYEFKTARVKPGFSEWLRYGGVDGEYRHRHMFADLTCFLVMIPLVAICAWLTVHACQIYGLQTFRWEIFALALLFIVLTLIFLIWVALATHYHYRSWCLWRDHHQRMRIELSDDSISFTSIINAHSRAVEDMIHINSGNDSQITPSDSGGLLEDGQRVQLRVHWPQPIESPLFTSIPLFEPAGRFSTHNGGSDMSVKYGSLCNTSSDSPLEEADLSPEALLDRFNHSCLTPMPPRVRSVRASITMEDKRALLDNILVQTQQDSSGSICLMNLRRSFLTPSPRGSSSTSYTPISGGGEARKSGQTECIPLTVHYSH